MIFINLFLMLQKYYKAWHLGISGIQTPLRLGAQE